MTILTKSLWSALMMTSVFVECGILVLTRFPNVCTLDFGRGTKISTSLVCCCFTTKVMSVSFPFCFAVSKLFDILLNVLTPDAMLISGNSSILHDLNGLLQLSVGTHHFANIVIFLYVWLLLFL